MCVPPCHRDVGEAYDADRLHPEFVQSLLTELDDLIDKYARSARAGFRLGHGQRGLTRVIEAVMDTGQANPPTLAA